MDRKLSEFICRDKRLRTARTEGKDLYSTFASVLYDIPYEECLEFRDGEPYIAGKKRRAVAKAIVLAMYFGNYETVRGIMK